jgi:SAM-dependent methyltransferase
MKARNDYSQITETPGSRVTAEQLSRAYQRYFFAVPYCRDKDVLEVACGGGAGLGLLVEAARSVTAIDLEEKNLQRAREIYQDDPKVKVLWGDAQRLEFPQNSFDVVLLYEAIYYLPRPEFFLQECRRVLRPGGHLLIGSANREWKDFNPSAYSTRYFSCAELQQLMREHDFETELFKGFPVPERNGFKGRLLSLIKRTAVRLHLIPKSMKYKKFLKRLFVGKLVLLPRRLTSGVAEYLPPLPVDPGDPDRQFKVIYAVGRLRET